MTAGAIHALGIPASLRHDVEQIFTLTDPFCAEYLDTEYGELVRKLIAKCSVAEIRRQVFRSAAPGGQGATTEQIGNL